MLMESAHCSCDSEVAFLGRDTNMSSFFNGINISIVQGHLYLRSTSTREKLIFIECVIEIGLIQQ